MIQNSHLLIVDSDSTVISKVSSIALRSKLVPICINNPHASVYQLEKGRYGMGFIGPSLKPEDCLKNILKLKTIDRSMPILMAMKEGLFEDIKNISPVDDLIWVPPLLDEESIIETITEIRENNGDKPPVHHELPLIVGQSTEIKGVRKTIKRLSDKNVTILITGESGTGKDLVARSIHYDSPRKSGPFVKLSCTVLPAELLESELFGFQKGAFTDAYKNKPGRLELANEGTLFIDEIGELPFPLQAKFLHMLEDKSVSRLGDTEDMDVDVRIVAATNLDLAKRLDDGLFRNDLFYRLNIVNVNVPALRDRNDDIPIMAYYFMEKCSYELKRTPLKLPDEIIAYFGDYPWPGNVRELENLIRKIIIIGDPYIVFEDTQSAGISAESDISTDSPIPDIYWDDKQISDVFRNNDFSIKKTSKAFVSHAERSEILKALNHTRWNRRKAAELLQVSYKTLLNRIQELGLEK